MTTMAVIVKSFHGRRNILESGGLERILRILVTTPTNIVYV